MTQTDEHLDARFAALSEPSRRAIVHRLAVGDATVNELAEAFPLTLEAVSRHVKVLERRGLTSQKVDPQRRPHHVEFENMTGLAASLDALEAHLEAIQRKENQPVTSPTTSARGEFSITRTLNAPRPLVWEAFTQPQHLAQFWGGPDITVPLDSVVMDVRAGGRFELTMITPEGTEMPNQGHYVAVDEPERMVFTEPDMGISATITFTAHGDETTVTVHQTGVPEEFLGPEAEAGFASMFDKLADLLDRLQVARPPHRPAGCTPG